MRIFILSIILILSAAVSAQVKILFPPKQWEITLDVNNFEPSDVLTGKPIMGGRTGDDFIIDITTEQVEPGTPVSKAREEYSKRDLAFAQKDSVVSFDFNNIACIAFYHKADMPITHKKDKNKSEKELVKEVVNNRWSYHGYIVKEDVAFDVNISFNMTDAGKARVEQILKSIKIDDSAELKELSPILRMRKSEVNTLTTALIFADKYPKNSGIYYFIGEIYFGVGNYPKAQEYYLKALKCHKSEPLVFADALWFCYDGLGLTYSMQKQYEQAIVYLTKSYEMTKNDNAHRANSAYHLASVYAMTDNVPKSLEFLKESVSLQKSNKGRALDDSSFKKLKDNPKFKKLVGR
jgi:tetratricopeptide (TPR) repeat protein